MAQPTPYTRTTDFSADEASNVGGRSTVRTDRIDAEMDDIAVTTGGILESLADIQRDDGKLLDGLVEYYNLSASCKAAVLATKWTARGLWATGADYVVSDMVDVSGATYICAIAHTSGVFATDYAAGKWQIFISPPNAAALNFTQTATIAATNAQAAIEEVDSEGRARSLPLLSALYGGL